jgi:hypothetical protein
MRRVGGLGSILGLELYAEDMNGCRWSVEGSNDLVVVTQREVG